MKSLVFSFQRQKRGILFLCIDIFSFLYLEEKNIPFQRQKTGYNFFNVGSGAPGGVEIRFSSNWAYRLRGEVKETHKQNVVGTNFDIFIFFISTTKKGYIIFVYRYFLFLYFVIFIFFISTTKKGYIIFVHRYFLFFRFLYF